MNFLYGFIFGFLLRKLLIALVIIAIVPSLLSVGLKPLLNNVNSDTIFLWSSAALMPALLTILYLLGMRKYPSFSLAVLIVIIWQVIGGVFINYLVISDKLGLLFRKQEQLQKLEIETMAGMDLASFAKITLAIGLVCCALKLMIDWRDSHKLIVANDR